MPKATQCPGRDENLSPGPELVDCAPAFTSLSSGPGRAGGLQGLRLRGPRLRSPLPHSTWRSCPSWHTTPSRCRAATRRWSRCGSTGCSSVSTCPAPPCSSSEPRSTCERWAPAPPTFLSLLGRGPSLHGLPPWPCLLVGPAAAALSPWSAQACSGLSGAPICWNTCPSVHLLIRTPLSGFALETPSSRKPSLLPKPLPAGPRTSVSLRQGLASAQHCASTQ